MSTIIVASPESIKQHALSGVNCTETHKKIVDDRIGDYLLYVSSVVDENGAWFSTEKNLNIQRFTVRFSLLRHPSSTSNSVVHSGCDFNLGWSIINNKILSFWDWYQSWMGKTIKQG